MWGDLVCDFIAIYQDLHTGWLGLRGKYAALGLPFDALTVEETLKSFFK